MRSYCFFSLFLDMVALPLCAEVVDIDSDELLRLQAAGVPVIDVRTAGEWQETGVVPGSRLLTFFDERGRADAAAWLAKVTPLAGPQRPVILICRSGGRSQSVGQFLTQEAGYATVYNVKGGILAWNRVGRPLMAAGAITACPGGVVPC